MASLAERTGVCMFKSTKLIQPKQSKDFVTVCQKTRVQGLLQNYFTGQIQTDLSGDYRIAPLKH